MLNKEFPVYFILVFLMCVFGFTALSQQATGQISYEETGFVKKDLLNFTSKNLLLSTEYPSEWSAEELAGTAYFREPIKDEIVLTIHMKKNLQFPQGSALNDFVNDELKVLENEISSSPSYSIKTPLNDGVGGEKAFTALYQHSSTLENLYVLGFRTYFVHNGNGYIIDFKSTEDNLQDQSKTHALQLEVNPIIDSIKLLDPEDFPEPAATENNSTTVPTPHGPCAGNWWSTPGCGLNQP
jgi:hypothetical protein